MEFIQTEFEFVNKNMTEKTNQVTNNSTENNYDISDKNNDGIVVDIPNEEDEVCEEVDDSDCLDIEKSTDTESASKIKIEGDTWIRQDMVPITKIKCYVPDELYSVIKNIEASVNRKFGSSNEFSIYIHGEFDEEGDLIVSPDYYIPKQRVGGASVDYLEEPEAYYNGCLHKHPTGCTSFSGTDKKYINSNFEFSLLYVNQKIHTGIINIKYFGNRRVQIPLDIITIEPDYEEIDIVNIEKEVPKPVTSYTPKVIGKPAASNTPSLLLPGFDNKRDNTVIQPTVFNGGMSNAEIDMETDMEEYFNNLGYRDI